MITALTLRGEAAQRRVRSSPYSSGPPLRFWSNPRVAVQLWIKRSVRDEGEGSRSPDHGVPQHATSDRLALLHLPPMGVGWTDRQIVFDTRLRPLSIGLSVAAKDRDLGIPFSAAIHKAEANGGSKPMEI